MQSYSGVDKQYLASAISDANDTSKTTIFTNWLSDIENMELGVVGSEEFCIERGSYPSEQHITPPAYDKETYEFEFKSRADLNKYYEHLEVFETECMHKVMSDFKLDVSGDLSILD